MCLDVSVPLNELTIKQTRELNLIAGVSITEENAEDVASRIGAMPREELHGIVRSTACGNHQLHATANKLHIPLIAGKLIGNGRLELRHWFREKCISETTHRYGNLLPRFRDR